MSVASQRDVDKIKGSSRFQGTTLFGICFNESADIEVVIHPEGQREVTHASETVFVGLG
jgi:quinolinate synthase